MRRWFALLAIIVVCAGVGSALPGQVAAQFSCNILASDQDSDGDTIPNDLDPDDDNDGIVDQDDPNPCDASVPGSIPPPVYDPVASDQDSDGDTIPNDLDPDDDNDGIVDRDDTTAPEADPQAPVVPDQPETTAPVVTDQPETAAPVVADVPADTTAQAPMVTSLPRTGVGAVHQGELVLIAGGVLLVAAALRQYATHRP